MGYFWILLDGLRIFFGFWFLPSFDSPSFKIRNSPPPPLGGDNWTFHEDPHTTFFCTQHDAGVVKDAKF